MHLRRSTRRISGAHSENSMAEQTEDPVRYNATIIYYLFFVVKIMLHVPREEETLIA